MIDVPDLTDGPVLLRRHRDDDIPGVVEQSVDEVSRRWTTIPLDYTRDDARRFVREIMPGGWESDQEWGFAVDVGGRYAGTVSLRNRGSDRAEIAYGSHPWVRGTGHVGTALRLLVDWGFATRDLQTIVWWANHGNWASRKTAWRLGFTVGGTVRRWLPQRGDLVDAWVGTLRREDPREPTGQWYDAAPLTGDGVVLRPLREDDAARVVEACSDERTTRWFGRMPTPYTAADAVAWIDDCREGAATGRKMTWAIADPHDDRMLGVINLFDLVLGEEGEVGYWMHPDARSRGLMTEATRVVCRHAFDDLGLQIVRAVAAEDNAASRRVMEANGFRLFGVERRGTRVRDGYADAARYDLVREEFADR